MNLAKKMLASVKSSSDKSLREGKVLEGGEEEKSYELPDL